ncbi:hypothetical protein ACFL1W_01185 [Candidatus Margulisiibacteriota bacterium]
MNKLLKIVFAALLINFAFILSFFFTRSLRHSFLFLIAAFFVLGITLVALTIKQKVAGSILVSTKS